MPKKIKDGNTALYQPFSNMFNAYTKAFNKKYNRVGSLFQKHPKRIRISNEDYLRHLILYVNTNTNHHGIANFLNYKFTSYQDIISDKPTFLKKNEVVKWFDNIDNFKYVHRQKMDSISQIKDLLIE